jgi:hypothetical protein
MKLAALQTRLFKKFFKLGSQASNNVIDIRAFDAIDFLSRGLAVGSEPFSILDLGCSGGPTNAWVRNWNNYRWVGIDADIRAIKKLESLLPVGSEVMHGYVYSNKFCSHAVPIDAPQLEIDALLSRNSYDFVKIDIDGCDLHILEGILNSAVKQKILGVEIEVTYSTFRDSNVNFADCASLLIDKDFELVAIESARRYSNGEIFSPYVWDIPAQTGMGKVFQGNQLWVKRQIPTDERSQVVGSLILAAFGLSDWAWGLMQKLVDDHGGKYLSVQKDKLQRYFIPKFIGAEGADINEGVDDSEWFKMWRIQSQNREIEQPWFLSN